MGNQKGYEDTLQEMLQAPPQEQAPQEQAPSQEQASLQEQAPSQEQAPQEQAPPIALYTTLLPKIFDALPKKGIQPPKDPLSQIEEARKQGQPLPEWTGIQKPITTIEERLKKLEARGMEIDMDRDIAEEILRDKGYHMLKEYAEAFVDQKKTEEARDGKPRYKEGTKFSYVHELYYANHEISGMLFEIIGHIETNLRNNMDYACSHAAGHHLWWLDTEMVNHSAHEAIPARSKKGTKRSSMDVKDFELKSETLKTALRYVSRRCENSNHNPPRILPYGHELLRAQHLGEQNNLFLRLKKLEVYEQIANQYKLNEKIRGYAMLSVLRNLRNAVAHYECLFTREHYADREIQEGSLFQNYKDREQVSLADAILVVQYFLYHISKVRRSEYMRTRLRKIFSEYTERCPALLPVFQQYYAYDVYMAETKEALDQVAEQYGYNKRWTAKLMGLYKTSPTQEAPAPPASAYDRLHRACRAIGAFAYRLVRR